MTLILGPAGPTTGTQAPRARLTGPRSIPHGLVVSVIPAASSPWNRIDDFVRLAIVANAGGAAAVRVGPAAAIREIRQALPELPIIGTHLGDDGRRAAPTQDEIAGLALSGADLVEVDVHDRRSVSGIRRAADDGFPIAARARSVTLAASAADAGARAVVFRNAFRGGTDSTVMNALSHALSEGIPILMEHEHDPVPVAAASLRLGAHAVIVGGAITDPLRQVRAYVAATGCLSAHSDSAERYG